MARHRKTGRAGGGNDAAGKPKSPRQLRVGEELRHALAQLFERGDMRDPDLRGASITVTQVDCSPDLRNAIAYVMPLGGVDRERLMAAMRRAAPYFRSQLARMVELRHAPELHFRIDESFDYAGRINTLLHSPDVARDLEAKDDAEKPSGTE
jgi:ribosome-binding factor A